MSSNPHTRLIDALLEIDGPRLRRMFDANAEFHAAMELVARVLPVVVGAIADDAARKH